MVKQYSQQVPKKLAGGGRNAYPSPCKLPAVEVTGHHYHHRVGSPNSVIRGNANFYYSSSSSGSAERASFSNLQQQVAPSHIMNRHIVHHGGDGKSKLMPPQHHDVKESSVLQQKIEGNTVATMNTTIDLSMPGLDNNQHGPHLTLLDIHQDLSQNKLALQPSYLQQQQQLVTTSTTTNSFAASKPYDPYVNHASKSIASTSGVDSAANSSGTKLPQYQSAHLNSLRNTLMQKYHPSFVVEDGKNTRLQSPNGVSPDGRNDGDRNPSNPKSTTSKRDEAEKWMNMKLNPPTTYNGSTQNVPLFKLSHNDHTFPIATAEQESCSLHPSYKKVHLSSLEFQPCHIQTNANVWDTSLLKDEVEKLASAVTCVQACLESIQSVPASRNTSNSPMNPFLARGVFGNMGQMNPSMKQHALRSNAQVETLMAQSGLRSAHVPGISNAEFFQGPVMAHGHHTSKLASHHIETQASQKDIHKLPGAAHIRSIKPLTKDMGGFAKGGEIFHVQIMPAKIRQGTPSRSYMKDTFTEITPSVSHRDMGTQMTPLQSSGNSSQSLSPCRAMAASPVRHNTPTKVPISTRTNVGRMNPMEVEKCQREKLELQGLSAVDQVQQFLGRSLNSNWGSREEEEGDIGKGQRHLDLEELKRDVMKARANAWEEATKLKLFAEYEREETKIQAWEDHKKAKADTELQNLEMKLLKKRLETTVKIARKLDAAHRRAEELRAAAMAHRLKGMEKTCGRANHMRRESNYMHARYPLSACFTHPMWKNLRL